MGVSDSPRDAEAPRLFGRSEELARIDGLVERAVAGRGGTLLIEGEPGLGKSALVTRATAEARSRGIAVFLGAGREWTLTRPFAAIVEGFGISSAPDATPIAELLRTVSGEGEDGSSLRYRIVDEVADLVERRCGDSPVLVALEDLHWADASTLLTVHRLASQTQFLPLSLVCTTRPRPSGAEHRRVVEALSSAGDHIELRPLSDEEVFSLAAGLTGDPISPGLRDLVRRARGNPLFAVELLRAIGDKEAADLVGEELPLEFRHVVLARLGGLPQQTVDLLGGAAVLGTGFAIGDLSLVTGRATFELLDRLRPAVEVGVLSETNAGLRFSHDLVHQAFYEDMPASVRQSLHADAARKLDDAGAHPATVALHLERSAPPGDRPSVLRLHRAACEMVDRSPSVAVELLEKALELAEEPMPERPQIRADLAKALLQAGRTHESEMLARDLLNERRGGRFDRELLLTLGRALEVQGREHELVEQLEAAARSEGVPGGERSRLLTRLSQALLSVGSPDRSARVADEAVAVAREVADDTAVCLALVARADAETFGTPERGLETLREAMSVAESGRVDDDTAVRTMLALAGALSQVDWTAATRLLEAGARRAEDAGIALLAPAFHSGLGMLLSREGRFDEAEAEFETAVTLSRELGAAPGVGLVTLAMVALRRGNLEEARALAAQAEGDGTPEVKTVVCMVEMAVLEERRDHKGAFARLLRTFDALIDSRARILVVNLAVHAARLGVLLGKEAEAEAVVRVLEEVAAANPRYPILRGRARLSRCILDQEPDGVVEAIAAIREGMFGVDAFGRALEEGGVLLVGAGRTEEGLTLLEEALDIWQRTGAVHHQARLEERLQDLTGRPTRRRRRPVTGWDALTETELKVASLVLERLRYREIADRLVISRRTVETHVAHIFQKLGVSSRWEMEDRARRELPPSPTAL